MALTEKEGFGLFPGIRSGGRGGTDARDSRWRLGVISALVALALASGVAVANVADPSGPAIQGIERLERAPPDSYLSVEGVVYEADGITPAVGCVVNVTNKNTSAWGLTTTDTYGFYGFNTEDFGVSPAYSDVINVTATKDTQIGWNETVVGSAFIVLVVDVALSGAIPEFPSTLVPVLGLMSLVALVSAARRGRN